MAIKKYSKRIAELDPKKDHQEIIFLLSCHIFPWDTEKALEFALFRTFAVPSISRLLSYTQEFTKRPRKRYDDTELIMYEIMEQGYDSERAKQAFQRLNKMHGAYKISNEDFLYVLSTFIYEPRRWVNRFAWRKFTDTERMAGFYFFKEVGKRMGIKNIPEDYDRFEQFNQEYEAKHFKYAPSNREIGDSTVNLLMSFYLPKWLIPMGKPFAYALMDKPLLDAMGFPQPNILIRSLIYAALKFRALLTRFIPEPNKPVLGTKRKRPTYPKGYEIEELGTFPSKQEYH